MTISFIFSLFYLFNVSFTSCVLIALIFPSLHIHPLPLQSPPSKKPQNLRGKKRKINKEKILNPIIEAAV